MSKRPPSSTILFWWTATIGSDPRNPDSITLGKLLPPPDAGSSIPQSIAAMPLAHRAYYPACYIPVTYGDVIAYAESRGDDLGRENIRQRGHHVAAVRVEAANYYLNWNQTARQRTTQLRKLKILALLPSLKAVAALGIDTSPVFGEEPPPRYRGSAIVTNKSEKGKAKAKVRKGAGRKGDSPTVRAAIQREAAAQAGRQLNPDLHPTHQVVVTKHRPVAAPLPHSPPPLDRTTVPVEEGDAIIEHPNGDPRTVAVDAGYAWPHSAGLLPEMLILKGMDSPPTPNRIVTAATFDDAALAVMEYADLITPPFIYCPADKVHEWGMQVANCTGLNAAHIVGYGMAILNSEGVQAARLLPAK